MKDLRGLLVAGVFSLTAAAALAGPPGSPPAAIPTNDPAQARAESSFQTFASEWMQKMERVENQNRAQAHGSSYRGYASEFTTELKPTGSASAPYVGLLRYNEQTCAAGSASECQVAGIVKVTEIFRYQGGRWIY
jgi:hypothetical protein